MTRSERKLSNLMHDLIGWTQEWHKLSQHCGETENLFYSIFFLRTLNISFYFFNFLQIWKIIKNTNKRMFTNSHMLLLLVVVFCFASVQCDVPTNCSYPDVVGKWTFYIGQSNFTVGYRYFKYTICFIFIIFSWKLSWKFLSLR